ncbi:MAG: amidase [Chloroflexi bacterium]|nr:amidase [Chloroflexota bacterium]MDA1145994.1 amidase [Chloroflexota bacterium]
MSRSEHERSLVEPAPLAAHVTAIRGGERSLREVVGEVCDRLEAIDLLVRAVVPEPGRRERLLREAGDLEARYPDPESRPPLYGALLGVKDIIAVDGMPTRGGSALPPEVLAMAEATAVRRMRDAGALVLGKTVTTEFAAREPGATTNPRDRAHTPGGSSSGSAAGIAAGLFHVSFGTQTVGSVIRPAAFCGVVGFKPSHERIPRDGVLTYSESVDHVGLFSADAAGMRIAAGAVLSAWNAAPDAAGAGERMPVIGVAEGAYLEQADEEARAALDGALARLEAAGARVVRLRVLDDIKAINARHEALVAAEFAGAHHDRFEAWGQLYRPFSANHVEEGRAVPAAAVAEGRASRFELRERLDGLFAEYGLDLLASVPAVGTAPHGLAWTGDASMNLPWTHSGLPVVMLPAGSGSDGLPLGVQLATPFGQDEALLGWAARLEATIATS